MLVFKFDLGSTSIVCKAFYRISVLLSPFVIPHHIIINFIAFKRLPTMGESKCTNMEALSVHFCVQIKPQLSQMSLLTAIRRDAGASISAMSSFCLAVVYYFTYRISVCKSENGVCGRLLEGHNLLAPGLYVCSHNPRSLICSKVNVRRNGLTCRHLNAMRQSLTHSR